MKKKIILEPVYVDIETRLDKKYTKKINMLDNKLNNCIKEVNILAMKNNEKDKKIEELYRINDIMDDNTNRALDELRKYIELITEERKKESISGNCTHIN